MFKLSTGFFNKSLGNSQRYTGFTLAEVLITLGIIGIVATMTIPTLIKVYKKSVIETRLKSFYSEINQAVKLSEVENGNSSTWTYPNGYYDYDGVKTFFNTYLKDYLHYAKITKDSNSLWPTYGMIVYLNNGSAFHLSGASAAYNDYIWFTFYPVAAKKTNAGIDVFLFMLTKDKTNKIKPFSTTAFPCSNSDVRHRRDCANLIMKNNWKIPDDYPWIK